MASSFDAQTMGRSIKRLLIGAVVLALVTWIGCSTTKRVEAGYVGVKVKLAGSSGGVQPDPLMPGWHVYNPITEQIIMFPTHLFNVVWTQSAHEGRAVDESITFSSSEGASVNTDIGLSFHVDPPGAPVFYQRFRENDVLATAAGYMRNTVREAFSEAASKRLVAEIYGEQKTAMLKDATDKCREIFGKDGITIDQLTINGALRLPKSVEDGINAKLEQLQRTQASENKVAQFHAEADQQITAAHGAAEAARQKAQGEADAMLIRARAEAQANEIIRLSVTPTVLQYRALVDRWDGQLPKYTGGGQVPLLTFDVSKAENIPEADRQKRLHDLMEQSKQPSEPQKPTPPAPTAVPAPPQPPAKGRQFVSFELAAQGAGGSRTSLGTVGVAPPLRGSAPQQG